MKVGDLIRYREDIHNDIGVVVKIHKRRLPDRLTAMIRRVDDLSTDYFNERDWGLLEVLSASN